MVLEIESAEKVKLYARVCLWGVEKSGKTHNALMLATAFAGEHGKVAVISSEYGSSRLLAPKFPHDMIDLAKADKFGKRPKEPFTPQRYEEALELLQDKGYAAIVIDSLSHAWSGEGGILGIVDKAGGGFNDGWGKGTPAYNHLIDTLLAAKCHVIVTLRAKEAYEQQEYIKKKDGSRGTAPKNVGQAPVMRKGFGYEMQLILRMDELTAYVQASAVEDYIPKGEEIERPGPELAYRLLGALDGVPLPEPTPQELAIRESLAEFQQLYPSYCAKTPDWTTVAMRKALSLADDVALPEYTDEHVQLVSDYVAAKRQEQADKGNDKASEQQHASIKKLCQHLGKEPDPAWGAMSYQQAKDLIAELSLEYRQGRQKAS